jgi:hypothetical protein
MSYNWVWTHKSSIRNQLIQLNLSVCTHESSPMEYKVSVWNREIKMNKLRIRKSLENEKIKQNQNQTKTVASPILWLGFKLSWLWVVVLLAEKKRLFEVGNFEAVETDWLKEIKNKNYSTLQLFLIKLSVARSF